MQIRVNSDHNIEGRELHNAEIAGVIENSLSRFNDRITRVEIHLGDENGSKGGSRDKRCTIEARLRGRRPLAVTEQASSLDEAIRGAAGKLERLIESTIGRWSER